MAIHVIDALARFLSSGVKEKVKKKQGKMLFSLSEASDFMLLKQNNSDRHYIYKFVEGKSKNFLVGIGLLRKIDWIMLSK